MADLTLLLVLLLAGSTGVDDHVAYDAKLRAVSAFTYALIGSLALGFLLRIAFSYCALKRQLAEAPLTVYTASIDKKPLDEHEVRLLFRTLDRDGKGLISVDEIFDRIVETNAKTRNADATVKAAVLLHLKKKPACATDLTLAKFLGCYKVILDEIDFLARQPCADKTTDKQV